MTKICLITPGQPSTNPRLVKEADALNEAGYVVQVVANHRVKWADNFDGELLRYRPWSCTFVDSRRSSNRLLFYKSRLRHRLAKRLISKVGLHSFLVKRAICPVAPELIKKVESIEADLYIAHYLPALLAALTAARKYKTKVGFDAEDFHSGGYSREEDSLDFQLTRYFEKRYISECDYVTAASPGIAKAYEKLCSIQRPKTILNVFPRSQQPRVPPYETGNSTGPLRLYWFSQTIGADRGLEDVIKALMQLNNQYAVEFHLRGQWQVDFKRKLEQLAIEGGVRNQLRVHPPAPPGKMVSLAANFDVGLALEQQHNSKRDLCLTNKIFTYLLAGIPIIATATRGQRPIMQSIGRAGCLYNPGDGKALAECIRRWAEDREELNRAKKEAWRYGNTRYNWDREKHKFLEIVKRALNGV